MRKAWAWCAAALLMLPACARQQSPYEKAVAALPPLYCYRTLADVDCYAEPVFRDRRALVNFQGPPPGTYPAPDPPPPARLQPPPDIDHVCRVADPDPCPLVTPETAPAAAGTAAATVPPDAAVPERPSPPADADGEESDADEPPVADPSDT